MTRGTTPVYEITVKDFASLEDMECEVTLKQKDALCVFHHDEVEIEDNVITVQLSQEQTLAFGKGSVKMQVRGIDASGTAWASNIVTLPINPILRDGEIEYEGV